MFRGMSRIRSLVAFGAVLVSAVCSAADTIIYVKPGATGEGTSWDDPAELTAALTKAAPANVSAEVWLQEGTYEMTADSPNYAFWNKTAVRGGFKGTETSPAERPAGTVSTIDGCKTYQTLNSWTYGTGALFERICFYRSSRTGFNKYNSSGDVTFVDCSFVANGTDYGSNLNGRGACFEGAYHTETVSLTNCVFAGNTADPTRNMDIATGYGAFFRNLKEAVLVNCLFVTNGCDWVRTVDTSVRTSNGLAFRVQNAPVTARGCRFIANAGFTGGGAGVVELQENCDGSLFENCLWAGNRLTRDISYNGFAGGLVVNIGSIERTVTVKGCTFAYNLIGSEKGAAGISVNSGTVAVKNSIFYGNVVPATTTLDNDVEVLSSDGAATISYSVLDHKPVTATCDHLTQGAAKFVTPLDDFLACIDADEPAYPKTTVSDPRKLVFKTDDATLAALLALDVHGLSKKGYYKNDGNLYTDATENSPAIDAGDPQDAVGDETDPNGGIVNAGIYGGTAQAAQSNVSQPELDPDDVTIEWVGGWSQPRITVTLGGAGDYSASVTIDLGQDGTTWTESYSAGGIKSGVPLTWTSDTFYDPKGRLYVRVTVTAPGAQTVTVQKDVAIEAPMPPWAGKGGDPTKIIHLRAGANGAQDGTSWTAAFSSLKQAMAALTATKNEIWIAGTNVLTESTPSCMKNFAVSLRGGFDGSENTPEARKPGTESVLDGADAYAVLTFNMYSQVDIERLTVTRSQVYGVAKYGNGPTRITDCRFLANGTKTTQANASGRGLHVEGTNGGVATLAVSNCVFEGNIDGLGNYDSGLGHGLWVRWLKSATVDNCLFLTNGFDIARTAGTSVRTAQGSALYIDASVARVSNCRFIGNTLFTGYEGGVVYVNGNCDGTVFDHCLWLANRETRGISASGDHGLMGPLCVSLGAIGQTVTVKGCTFAYNLIGTVSGSAGVNVMSGTVGIRDSVFYGNVVPATCTADNDIAVLSSSGAATVSYSVLDHEPPSATCDHLTLGAAKFVTPLGDFLACIDADEPAYPKTAKSPVSFYFKTDAATLGALTSFDAHGLSKAGYYKNDGKLYEDAAETTPAVDAGDPASDWTNETDPNGGIVNAGFYGNTTEAARSNIGQPTLAAKDIVVEWVDGWSQPRITVTTGISEGDDYAATVTVRLSADGESWSETYAFGGVHPNDPKSYLSNLIFDPETDRIYIRVAVTASGAEPVGQSKDEEVTGKMPPWAGKGGDPAKVVHLRFGAYGAQDGTSWTRAFSSLEKALSALTAERNELWIAGSNALAVSTATFAPGSACTIRGGFAGTENSPADRADGVQAVLDGAGEWMPFTAANTVPVTFERIRFRNGLTASFEKKASSGALFFEGCAFGEISKTVTYYTDYPHGVMFTGAADAEATFTDCVFADVVTTNQMYFTPGYGFGAYFTTFRRITLDGCVFARCGRPYDFPRAGTQYESYGAAFAAESAPVTARNCTFVGNALNEQGMNGGIVNLRGNCDGTVFTNCAWIANECLYDGVYGPSSGSGALVVKADTAARRVDVQNCTFAYNISDASESPADLNVILGDVTVGNSIFWGEVTNVNNCVGKAIRVQAGASCHVDYSLLDAAEDASAAADASLTVEHGLVGDPRFVYGFAPYTNALSRASYGTNIGTYNRICLPTDFATSIEPNLNIHLRGGSGYVDEVTHVQTRASGRTSIAVDAGDPLSDYSNETTPNGGRVNLGRYGNTPWATMARPGTVIFVR